MKSFNFENSNDIIVDNVYGEYALYLRKSRADIEAEARGEGETLARHEKILFELAKRYNFSIGKIYREIVSGESIEARPVVQELLRDVQSGRWKGVLVVEVERLARGDTIDQGRVAKSFKFSNTKIITPIKIYDPNDEFDEEYFEFGLFMSRREYKVINRRLQRGRVSSVKEGKFVGSIPPYGYYKTKIEKDKGYTLTRNDKEAEVVKKVYNMYAYNNLSMQEIAKQLNNAGFKPRIASKWNISVIKDMLNNPVYIGKIRWDSRKIIKEYKNGKIIETRPRNSNYILCDGVHEHLIDDETWKIVQERRSKNLPPVPHNNVIQNPLAGLMYCAKCGKKMQRRPYKKYGFEATLICPNLECNNISTKLCIVEEKIIEALRDWLKNYELDYDGYIYKVCSKNKKMLEENIKNLKKELEMQNKKLIKIYDFFEDGTYTKKVFLERCSAINSIINTIKKNIEKFEQQLEFENKREEEKKKIIPKIYNIIDLYSNLETPEQKNMLLRTVIRKIEYKKEEKAIKKDSDPTNFELDIYPNI